MSKSTKSPVKVNLDEAARDLAQATITIDGRDFHPVPLTTRARRDIKSVLSGLRRVGRRVDSLNADLEKAEEKHELDKCDELDEQIGGLEDEAEALTLKLLAQQLQDADGEHPDPELISEKVPAQLQKQVFEFLSDAAGVDDADPSTTAQTPTPTTSA